MEITSFVYHLEFPLSLLFFSSGLNFKLNRASYIRSASIAAATIFQCIPSEADKETPQKLISVLLTMKSVLPTFFIYEKTRHQS